MNAIHLSAHGPYAGGGAIVHWNPEDRSFWAGEGRAVAVRNLWLSVPALVLAFAVWMSWSVVVVHLPAAGFRFSTHQLFWLASLPALAGATLRFFYAFAVPLFGGRRWTALSTASLLVPALGIGLAVQNPGTPYEAMVLLALLCGLGGANFASSMSHVSFLYPHARLGTALGLNAGLGNLGVPLAQALLPVAIGLSMFGPLGGAPQAGVPADGSAAAPLWLQNAGFVWVPLIAASALAAWFGMNDLAVARSGVAQQAGFLRRRDTWILSLLYTGSFGAFIGLSAALPLLVASQFPHWSAGALLWACPLLGALARPVGGWLADRHGGAPVSVLAFGLLAVASAMAALGLPGGLEPTGLPGLFMLAMVASFGASGVANGSTFKMIPVVYRHLQRAQMAAAHGVAALSAVQLERADRQGMREAAAALGFAGAVAAYGGFFIPKALGSSIAATGAAQAALAVFAVFFVACAAVTAWRYARREAALPC